MKTAEFLRQKHPTTQCKVSVFSVTVGAFLDRPKSLHSKLASLRAHASSERLSQGIRKMLGVASSFLYLVMYEIGSDLLFT